jgi:meso-butanediol dehydrogenase/(S,S)-butanediol dehydrogenase/diacetyl reductase
VILKDKIILVTGATSGIGAATAVACAREGARVLATGRNTEAGAVLLSQLTGGDHQFLAANLAEKTQVESLIHTITNDFKLDGLINSAGVVHHATVPDTSNENWDDTIAVNLNAVFYLCRALIPSMIDQGGGVIVNVASTWGMVGAEQSAAYCASKGAVIQLTRSMAMDHARHNVRINAVAPGAVDTPMLEAEAAEFGLTADEGRKLWAADAPTRSLASANDIAEAIVFLMSDKARHIHGTVLPVDGGSLAG